ncbi:DUF1707 SHOCT-like domain-containing protein [Nonomuraea diastatica]|uniref:DUF1707 SHOCT-like domain-containing protein n=1 Tax=Nonomuraea diastatica TaxID=1848329 RepID=UPI001409D924|nr:DUF1707 domain-containing protein [Nonomuraea diastatica]
MDRNDLRIGDAEREQTMAALREHFAQGRLTHEELEERLDRTLAAKTARDLVSITADLPGPGYHTPTPQPDMGDWRAAMHAHRQQMQEMRRAHRDMRHHWGHHPWRRHRGPHPIVPLLFVAMMLGLFFGGFGVFKVLLVVWVAAVVVSVVRRRFHDRR